MATQDFFELLKAYEERPNLMLYPALVPEPMNYMERVMADGRVTPLELITELFPGEQETPPSAVGAFRLSESGLLERSYQGSSGLSLSWEEPLVVVAHCFPYEDGEGVELSLSMRQRGAPYTEPWLRVRTVWPVDGVDTRALSVKQVYALYMRPADFQGLWRLLQTASRLHGDVRALPDVFDDEVEPQQLNVMSSEGEVMVCVACGATAVGLLGPEAYHCYVCGYEGGEGYARYQVNKRRAMYAELPYSQRRALALEDLQSAWHDVETALKFRWDNHDMAMSDNFNVLWEGVEPGRMGEESKQYLIQCFRSLEEVALKLPERAEAVAEIMAQRDRYLSVNETRCLELQGKLKLLIDSVPRLQPRSVED